MPKRGPAELHAACEHYLTTFFHDRDSESSKALAAPEISGFGTGIDEKVYEIEDAAALYARDVEQVPSPVHYTLRRSKAFLLSKDMGLVMGEMDWHLHLAAQNVIMREVRFSLVFRQEGNQWQLCHKHLSQPSTVHGYGEAYPLKELEDRAAVLERMVAQRTEELEAAHEKLHRLATTDLVTGLHNRYHADEVLRNELARRARADSDLAIILLDVDHFKPINDFWGHHTGDEVLRALAAVLRERVRETDTLGRWGGEEFILICPATNLSQAISLAEDLCQRVAAQRFPVDRDVTVSLGVTAHYAGEPGHILLERADRALYQAKAAGRNRAVALMR
ncbi:MULTISPECIES: diguanylate cyclase [Halorhodospira]|uniref:GGDEF domain-containing protein n=1 Tax=Halorhodospira TaxID=85108 RepID=UPI001EE83CD2|nr:MULTISPECIES: diguanylate cyclase [Halorhodospira]MCG5529199.1 diguanylate cyclase [Halorhodospira halophila]MCG5543110.1 diguanylate cyclase [Halorhodospira sp. 9628]